MIHGGLRAGKTETASARRPRDGRPGVFLLTAMTRLSLTIAALLVLSPLARAGLHYSGETTAELPSRWRGFLIDHRSLRSAGVEKPGNLPPSPLRDHHLPPAKKLEQAPTPRPARSPPTGCPPSGLCPPGSGPPKRPSTSPAQRPASSRITSASPPTSGRHGNWPAIWNRPRSTSKTPSGSPPSRSARPSGIT